MKKVIFFILAAITFAACSANSTETNTETLTETNTETLTETNIETTTETNA